MFLLRNAFGFRMSVFWATCFSWIRRDNLFAIFWYTRHGAALGISLTALIGRSEEGGMDLLDVSKCLTSSSDNKHTSVTHESVTASRLEVWMFVSLSAQPPNFAVIPVCLVKQLKCLCKIFAKFAAKFHTHTLFFRLFHCHFVTNPTNSLCTCSVRQM